MQRNVFRDFSMIMLKKYLLLIIADLKTLISYPKKYLFTFTYYIPSPPKRNQGYQEKHFDRLINRIAKMQIEIISIQTASNHIQQYGGMWVICTLKARKKEMDLINSWDNNNDSLEEIPDDMKSSDEQSLNQKNEVELPKYNDKNLEEEKIKGLYHIK